MATRISLRWRWRYALGAPLLGLLTALGGCLSVKSEHEIKPIHITMDINLKVDRELNSFFGDIDEPAKAKE